jgi:hypothetical protein
MSPFCHILLRAVGDRLAIRVAVEWNVASRVEEPDDPVGLFGVRTSATLTAKTRWQAARREHILNSPSAGCCSQIGHGVQK